jgi:tellurite resistance protein
MNVTPDAGPPIALFGSVMGIASLGLGWRIAAPALGVPLVIGESIIALALALFVWLAIRYIIKMVRSPQSVRAEFDNPVMASYFGTVTISLSLFAIACVVYSHIFATIVWAIAAIASVVLLCTLLARWITQPRTLLQMTPALFIPITGNAVAVYAAVPLGYIDFAWPLFAIAVMTWLTVQPLAFYRMFFAEPIPVQMAPQMALLVSSPAVFASAWFTIVGGLDGLFRMFAYYALFLGIIVIITTQRTPKAAYSHALWGYTFPAAAVAGAFLRYALAVTSPLTLTLAWVTLSAATLIVAVVGVRSLIAERK